MDNEEIIYDEFDEEKNEYEYNPEERYELTCNDCPVDECTGHCMSCPYR